MNSLWLVYPMAALVLLTAVVLGILFRSRVRAVREGRITTQFYRSFQGELEPDSALRPARHFANLFEAPTLFYAGCLAAMISADHGPLLCAIAWAYVIARLWHTCIHLGANRLRWRIRAYFSSWLLLVALWFHVVLHVALRT